MRTRPIGSAVGAITGLAFVLINAGAVPATLLWCSVAAIGSIAILWIVVLRGPDVEQTPPDRSTLRTYGISVLAMAAAIPVGAHILTHTLDRPNAVLVWVVFVVGVHFLPFAHAFHLPVFRWLAAGLIAISALGAVPALISDSAVAAGWTGVAAGFILLFFSAAGPRLGRAPTHSF